MEGGGDGINLTLKDGETIVGTALSGNVLAITYVFSLSAALRHTSREEAQRILSGRGGDIYIGTADSPTQSQATGHTPTI